MRLRTLLLDPMPIGIFVGWYLASMAWETFCRLTGYGANLLCALASHHEDDVSLRRVDIVILEEEGLIDTVLLQCTEFDN